MPSFIRTIGIDGFELPECALARWYVARLAAEGRDDLARIDDGGADEPTRVDRPAHIAHRVFGTVADIAQRGEALIQDELCVVHAARRVHDGAGSNRHDLRE